MENDTVLLFTRNGLGHGPEELQRGLAFKFLSLTLELGNLPAKIVFYTDGVRLCCSGSPVIDVLNTLAARGVELVLCQTCLVTFGLEDQVRVGIVGGMGDILEALQKAKKVVSL